MDRNLQVQTPSALVLRLSRVYISVLSFLKWQQVWGCNCWGAHTRSRNWHRLFLLFHQSWLILNPFSDLHQSQKQKHTSVPFFLFPLQWVFWCLSSFFTHFSSISVMFYKPLVVSSSQHCFYWLFTAHLYAANPDHMFVCSRIADLRSQWSLDATDPKMIFK